MLTMNLIRDAAKTCRDCSLPCALARGRRCVECHLSNRRAYYRRSARTQQMNLAAGRKWKLAHKPAVAAINRRAHAQEKHARPVAYLLRFAAQRAREKGIPFEISEADISIPERCPVLGIPLLPVGSGAQAGSPTLDRLVPELGYVPSNVVVISYRANTIKSYGTALEHEQIAAWMRGQGAV